MAFQPGDQFIKVPYSRTTWARIRWWNTHCVCWGEFLKSHWILKMCLGNGWIKNSQKAMPRLPLHLLPWFSFSFFFFSAFLLSEPHIVITIQSYTSTVLMCLLQIQCSRDDVQCSVVLTKTRFLIRLCLVFLLQLNAFWSKNTLICTITYAFFSSWQRLLLPFSQIQDEGLGKFLFLQTKMTYSCNLAVSTSVIHWWALRLYAASHCACLGSLAHWCECAGSEGTWLMLGYPVCQHSARPHSPYHPLGNNWPPTGWHTQQ